MIEIQADSKSRTVKTKLKGTEQTLFVEMCMILESYIEQLRDKLDDEAVEVTISALINVLNDRLYDESTTAVSNKVTISSKLVDFVSHFKDNSDEEKE